MIRLCSFSSITISTLGLILHARPTFSRIVATVSCVPPGYALQYAFAGREAVEKRASFRQLLAMKVSRYGDQGARPGSPIVHRPTR